MPTIITADRVSGSFTSTGSLGQLSLGGTSTSGSIQPSSSLHIQGNGAEGGIHMFRDQFPGAYGMRYYLVDSGADGQYLRFESQRNLNWTEVLRIGNGGNASNQTLQLVTGNISSSITSTGSFGAIHLPADAKIGFGTTTPAQAIDLRNGRIIMNNNYGYVQRDAAGNSATLLNQDGSDVLKVGDANHTEQIKLQTSQGSAIHFANGETTINEDGANINTRIEGDNDENLVFVDAGTNKVGIGKPMNNGDEKFYVGGDVGITGSLHVSGNISTSGSIIAKEFRTEFVNQIIATSSGSTTFGDGLDDVHRFTGSVNITGSITIPTGSLDVRGGVGGTDIATFARNVGATADIGIHAGSGDPQMTFTTPSRNFSIGASAGGHEFRISEHTAIGTDNRLIVRDDGDVFISQSLDFRAEHAADKIVLYNGGSEKIGTSAHTMILTAASHSFKDTDGHENLKITPTGDLVMLATGKLLFDGSATGHTYISEVGADTLKFFVGGQEMLKLIEGSDDFVHTLDNVYLAVGSSQDLTFHHDGTDSFIGNATGDLTIRNFTNDKDIIFQSDDGSGGVTSYFYLDGSSTKTVFAQSTQHADNAKAGFGAASDLEIWHDGSNTYIENEVGDFQIYNKADDKDVILSTDDGSGGTTAYITLDGSVGSVQIDKPTFISSSIQLDSANQRLLLTDNIQLKLGTGGDLFAYHDGTDTLFRNNTGNLYIDQLADDKDIILRSDDGSGGVTAYITLDGSANATKVATQLFINTTHDGSMYFTRDGGSAFSLEHDTSQLYFYNRTINEAVFMMQHAGPVIINQGGDDAVDFRVEGDNDANLFFTDASADKVGIGTNSPGAKLEVIGDISGSLTSTGSFGALVIDPLHKGFTIGNHNNKARLIYNAGYFQFTDADNSYGGIAAESGSFYGDVGIRATKKLYFDDGEPPVAGHTYISETAGDRLDFYVGGDHMFRMDEGNNAVMIPQDAGAATFQIGAGQDLEMYVDGTEAVIRNVNGDMKIMTQATDADMRFFSDDGSGGDDEYLRLDGGANALDMFVDTRLAATKKLYLDGGGNSYIHETSGDDVEIVVGGTVMVSLDQDDNEIKLGAANVSQSLSFFGKPESPDHMTFGSFSTSTSGWYRVARCGTVADGASNGTRASAKFTILDQRSSRHSALTFYAAGHFGKSMNIHILNSSDYAGTHGIVEQIRIVHGSTYEGFGVDVYINASIGSSAFQCYMEENYQDNGWTTENFAAVDADPPTNMAATAISCSYADSNVIEGFAHGNDTANGAVRWYRTENGVQFVSGSGGYAEQKTNSRYRFVTDSGYAEFGPQNSSFNHILTDRPKNYFNTQISVDGGIIASYDEDMQLRRADSTDDMIEIEASETKIFGDAVERVKFGSYGIKMENDSDAGGAAGYGVHIGAGNDLMLAHDGTNSFITNKTGHLYVSQSVSDKDIIFMTNDGGNIETPMKIVGSTGAILIAQPTRFQFANDQRIYDNGSGGLRVGAASHELELYCGGSDPMKFITGGISGNERLRLETAGDLHCDGDVIAASTTISDKRLKDNIITIDNGLSLINQIRGVKFDWNKGGRKGQKDIGLIAQEVEKVLPELVREKKMALIDDKEYLTVDYDKMVAVLVEAVKEQQVQIEELKEDIKELKK